MDNVEALKRRFPGRESQIDQLRNLFGHKDEPFVDATFVYGGPGVGKSSVVASLLTSCAVKYAVVNLIECYTSKILFETILNRLSGHRIDPRKGQPYAKCDNMMDFLVSLSECSRNTCDLDGSVIVLDKSERLRGMDFNLLAGFLRFRELCGLSISVVFLSEIPFQWYYAHGNMVEPIKVYFPRYSKETIGRILTLDYEGAVATVSCDDEAIDLNFYRNYLNVFLSVFYRACRDLTELRYTARLNFASYCKPVVNKECEPTNSLALWKHISPVLKASLQNLYLRISSKHATSNELKSFAFSKENIAQSLELPFYAKYLLIAAYLASYNPAKEDKRLFMTYHGKKRKTERDVKSKSKVSERLKTQVGPAAFGFDRLLAIFYSILDDKVSFNNNLLAQVSTLVELQLLSALSDGCNLDGQKYKCAVGLDFVEAISKMVGFNIRKYLVDFNYM